MLIASLFEQGREEGKGGEQRRCESWAVRKAEERCEEGGESDSWMTVPGRPTRPLFRIVGIYMLFGGVEFCICLPGGSWGAADPQQSQWITSG